MPGNKYDGASSMYNIAKDKWTVGPTMSVPRWKHSCCILGDILYAIAGNDQRNLATRSIESVNALDLMNGKKVKAWRLHDIYTTNNLYFESRESPLVAPINETSIVIMGGSPHYDTISIYNV